MVQQPEPQSLMIRGFAVRRNDGLWYAHCIDLSLDALAPTRDEALEKLQSAIADYLEWASERGLPLLRPSPLRFRLRYGAYALGDKLSALTQRPPRPKNPRRTFHNSPSFA